MKKYQNHFLLIFSFFILFLSNINATVIYGISPAYFSKGYKVTAFNEIKKRLPELKDLGVDTLWLQPIFLSAEFGQGYDTIDFYKINPALGTDDEFKSLVKTAHSLKMKVLLDIALNHTSEKHPYALDIIKNRRASIFYNYYQHEKYSNVPYSQFFNELLKGDISFIYYFWDKLINLNYSEKKVQQMALEIVSYWVKNFDIDGYRFDAGWGPSSRWPQFYPTFARTLRSIKSDVILIAEDKANYPEAYRGFNHPHLKNSGFDFAYDWKSEDPDWPSSWTFQLGEEESETIFNHNDKKESALAFYEALKLNKEKASIATLRYIENNDTGSFLQNHTLKETKFAAALMILLPGAPMLYYGCGTFINMFWEYGRLWATISK